LELSLKDIFLKSFSLESYKVRKVIP